MTRTVAMAERDISRVRDLPFGPARTRAAEAEVAKLSDEGPQEALPYGLFTQVEAYTFSEEASKAFVPFTQLLRLLDDHPEFFDPYDRHSVYWAYKWMVGDLMDFPEVPAAQIEQTLSDMATRYAVAGNGMNAVRLMEFYWALERGSPDVEERYQAWIATPRDDFSQCEACEPGDRAVYLAEHGRPQEAAHLIEQVLTTNPRCGTEPADMLSLLALLYLDTGRLDEAPVAYYRAVSELPAADGPMAGARGRQLVFLARTGNTSRAARELAANEDLLHAGSGVPARTLQYLSRVGAVTRTWMEAGQADLVIPLRTMGPHTAAQLHAWVVDKATGLAAAFDARNGTPVHGAQLRAACATPLPVTPVSLDLAHATFPAASPVRAATRVPDAVASPGEAFAIAERLARRDPAAAAGFYRSAAELYLQQGDLERAGYAGAEAAHCAQILGDLEGAARGYEEALAQLADADIPASTRAPVATQWIAALADSGNPADLERAAQVAADYRALIDAELATSPQEPASRDAALRLAETHARLLATRGCYEEGVALAQEVANAYSAAGVKVAAASGWELAGRILARHLGRPAEAEPLLRQACEAFAAAGARERHVEAAGLLIQALQAQGKVEEAGVVADRIS